MLFLLEYVQNNVNCRDKKKQHFRYLNIVNLLSYYVLCIIQC
jgi:hypothetical protein